MCLHYPEKNSIFHVTKTYLNFVRFREPNSKILTNIVFTVDVSEPLTHCKANVDYNHKDPNWLAPVRDPHGRNA